MKKLKVIMPLYLIALLYAFSSQIAHAEEYPWPLELNLAKVIFSRGLLSEFVDQEGLKKSKVNSTELDKYLFLSTKPAWISSRSCSLVSRKSGYFHTTAELNESETYSAKIAVPVLFKLQTAFLGAKRKSLLNSLVLKISTYKLDPKEFSLVPVRDYPFTVKDLCGLDSACVAGLSDDSKPIELNIQKPVVTPAFDFVKGTEISIRVTWSFEGICDEVSSDFRIGDQVRLNAVF